MRDWQVDDMGNPNKAKAMELVKMTAPDGGDDELSKMAGQCVDMHGTSQLGFLINVLIVAL